MSYIQITIGPLKKDKDGIDISGSNVRGLKFNNYAIEIMSPYQRTGSTFSFVYALFFGGLMGNSYAKREEPDYTFDEVIDWVDAMPKETKTQTIESVTNVLTETQLYKDLIATAEVPEMKTDDEKKTESGPLILQT